MTEHIGSSRLFIFARIATYSSGVNFYVSSKALPPILLRYYQEDNNIYLFISISFISRDDIMNFDQIWTDIKKKIYLDYCY